MKKWKGRKEGRKDGWKEGVCTSFSSKCKMEHATVGLLGFYRFTAPGLPTRPSVRVHVYGVVLSCFTSVFCIVENQFKLFFLNSTKNRYFFSC